MTITAKTDVTDVPFLATRLMMRILHIILQIIDMHCFIEPMFLIFFFF